MPFTQEQLSNLFNTDPQEEKLSLDERVNRFQQGNPSIGKSTNYNPGIGISYTHKQDPYEELGKYQDSFWSEMSAPALANLGGSFVNSIGQTAGTLFAGLPTMAYRFAEGQKASDVMAGLWENPVNLAFDSWTKKLAEEFPIYRTKDEQNASTLEHIFSKKFLADEASSGIGYLLGAYVAGMGAAKAFGGLRGNTFLHNSLTAGVEGELSAATKLTEFGSVINTTSSTFGTDIAKKIAISGIMASGEASAEAIGVKESITQRLEAERAQGLNKLTDEQIRQSAIVGGNMDFAVNLPIIAGTDMLMFGKQLRGGMSSEKAAFGKIVDGAEDLAPGIKKMEAAAVNPWMNRASRLGAGMLEEGGQEYAQSISQIGLTNYYGERHNPLAKSQVEGLFKTMMNTVEENSTDKETIISTFLGAVLGGPTQLITTRGERKTKDEATKKVVDVLNDLGRIGKLSDRAQHLTRTMAYGNESERAIKSGDNHTYANARYNELKSFVQSVEEAGATEVVLNRIKSMKSIPVDKFKEFFNIQGNVTLTEEDKANRIENLTKSVERIAQKHKDIKSKFPGLTAPVFDAVFDAVTNFENIDQREAMLANEIKKALPSFDYTELKDKKSKKDDKYKENLNKQMAFVKNSNPELFDELSEKLQDLEKLADRREFYIKQYNEATKDPKFNVKTNSAIEELRVSTEIKGDKVLRKYRTHTEQNELYGFQSSEFKIDVDKVTPKGDLSITWTDAQGVQHTEIATAASESRTAADGRIFKDYTLEDGTKVQRSNVTETPIDKTPGKETRRVKFKEGDPTTLVDKEGREYNSFDFIEELEESKTIEDSKEEIAKAARIKTLESLVKSLSEKIAALKETSESLTLKNQEYLETLKRAIQNKSKKAKLPGQTKFWMIKDIEALIQENKKQIQELDNAIVSIEADKKGFIGELSTTPIVNKDYEKIKEYIKQLEAQQKTVGGQIEAVKKSKESLEKALAILKRLLKGNYTGLSNLYKRLYGEELPSDWNAFRDEQKQKVFNMFEKGDLLYNIIKRTNQIEDSVEELEELNKALEEYETHFEILGKEILRLQAYKTTLEAEIRKAVTLAKAALVKEVATKPVVQEAEITEDPTSVKIKEAFIDSFKKGIEQIFSTTGSPDGVESTDLMQRRWFKTLPNLNLNNKESNYKLILVSADNAAYADFFAMHSVANPSLKEPGTIVAILAQSPKNNAAITTPVNENFTNIAQDNYADMVFTTIPTDELVGNFGDRYHLNNLDAATAKEESERYLNEYSAFRKGILEKNLNKEVVSVLVTRKSNGIFNNMNGVRNAQEDNTRPVEGTITKSEAAFKGAPVFVATDNTGNGVHEMSISGNKINLIPGLAYIKTQEGNVLPLFSRKLSPNEASTAVDLLKLYATSGKTITIKEGTKAAQTWGEWKPIPNYTPKKRWYKGKWVASKKKSKYISQKDGVHKKSGKLTYELRTNGKVREMRWEVKKGTDVASTTINILDQLTSLFYFGQHKDRVGNHNPNPKTEIYFSYVGGERILQFPNPDFKGTDYNSQEAFIRIPMTPQELENKREVLSRFLATKYHQVSNSIKQDDKFTRVTKVNPDGSVETKTYATYKEYLLSAKDRTTAEIPLTNGIAGTDVFKSMYLEFGQSKRKVTFTGEEGDAPTTTAATPAAEAPLEVGKVGVIAGGEEILPTDSPEETSRKLKKNAELIKAKIAARQSAATAGVEPTSNPVVVVPENVDIEAQENAMEAAANQGPQVTGNTEEQDQAIEDWLSKNNSEGAKRTAKTSDYKKIEIAKAKAWLKSVLPQVSIEEIEGLIDNRYFGLALDNVVKLSDIAEEGSEFHEAFHIVSLGILSPENRAKLYGEAVKIYGAPTKEDIAEMAALYPNQSAKELVDSFYEEKLAEAYRDYKMLGILPETKHDLTTLKGIFDWLASTIKSLLGIKSEIQKVFEGIDKGYFANKPINKFSARFRSFSPKISEKLNQEVMQGTAMKFINKLMQDGNFETYNNLESSDRDRLLKESLTEVLEELRKHYPKLEATEIAKKTDIKALVGLFIKGGKVETPPQEFLSAFNDFMLRINLDLNITKRSPVNFEELTEEESEEVRHGDSSYSGNEKFLEIGIKDNAPSRIKQIIASLPRVNKLGKPIPGTYGITLPARWGNTFSNLVKILAGKYSYTEQIEALKAAAVTHPELNNLVSFLKDYASEELRKEFQQTFARTFSEAVIFLYDGKKMYPVLALDETQAKKIKDRWKSEMIVNRGGPESILYSDNQGNILINKTKLARIPKILNLSVSQLEKVQAIAPYFGIEFSELETAGTDLAVILEQFKWIATHISEELTKRETGKEKSPFTVNDIFGEKLSKRFDTLLEYELQAGNEYGDLQYKAPDGKVRYAVHSPSYNNKIVDAINSAKTQDDLFAKYPHLNNSMTQSSFILKKDGYLFDELGNKKDKVFISGFHSGLKNTEELEGNVTTDLSKPERAAMQFNSLFGEPLTYNGKARDLIYPPLIRNSDKSLEPSFMMEQIFKETDFHDGWSQEILDYLKDALFDEIKTARALIEGVGSNVDIYNKSVGKLGVFQDVIAIDSEILNSDEVADEEIRFYIDSVEEKLLGMLQTIATNNANMLQTQGVITPVDGKYSVLGKETLFSAEEMEQKLRYFTATSVLTNMEQIKVFFNNVNNFGGVIKMFKRVAGSTGMKKYTSAELSDNAYVKEWLPRPDDAKRTPGTIRTVALSKLKIKSIHTEALRTAFMKQFKDVDFVNSLISKYENINEADGQGFVSLAEWREISWRLGEWRGDAAFNNAYEKAIKGETLSPKEMKYFQPKKLQYYGPVNNFDSIEPEQRPGNLTYFKFCVYPLLPSVTKAFKLENVKNFMDINGVGMMVSEPKIGAIEQEDGLANLYDIINDTFEFTEEGVMNVPYEFMGVQVDISYDIKTEGTLGSQPKKVLLGNLMSEGNGKPFRIFRNNQLFTIDSSELVKEFEDNFYDLLMSEQAKLIKTLKLEKLANGNYKITDWNKLAEVLKASALTSDAPTNFLDGLATIKDSDEVVRMQYPLDALPFRNKVENILLSLINNRVIAFKTDGGAKVEVSSAGWEANQRAFDNEHIYSSEKIRFYEEGAFGETLPAGLKTPLPDNYIEIVDTLYQTRNVSTFEERLALFNADIAAYVTNVIDENGKISKDSPRYQDNIIKKLITMAGYRIPSQGTNSLEYLEVIEFLHPEVGDIAITAPELVAKSGKDFDKDMLNLVYPYIEWNVSTDVDGIKMISQSLEDGVKLPEAGTKGAAVNKFIQHVSEILGSPDNFTNLTVPNNTNTLTALAEEVADKYDVKSFDIVNFSYIQHMGDVFLAAKDGVGTVALNITNHALAQRVGLEMNTTYGKEQNSKLYFSDWEKNPSYSLGREYDLLGKRRILDTLSEYANGYVDALADTFIFDINAGPYGEKVHLYLVRRGIPVNTVVYFMSQPIIKDYFKQLEKNDNDLLPKSQKDSRKVSKQKASEAYLAKVSEKTLKAYQENPLFFNTDNLKKWATTPTTTDDFYAGQIQVLDNFLKYSVEADAMMEVIKATAKDTNKPKSLEEARILEAFTQKPYKTGIIKKDGIDKLLYHGLIKGYTEIQKESIKLYSDAFVTEMPKSRILLDKLIEPYMNDRFVKEKDVISVAEKMKSEFLTYLILTQDFIVKGTPIQLYNHYQRIFKGKVSPTGSTILRSLAERVRSIQKKKDLKENEILRALIPVIEDKEYSVNGIKLINRKLNSMEHSILTEDLKALATSDNSEYRNIGLSIIQAGIIQSGLHPSYVSFLDKLPVDIYGNWVGQIINNYKVNNVLLDSFADQFFRNNWKDTRVVPYARGPVSGNVLTLRDPSPYLYLKTKVGEDVKLFRKSTDFSYIEVSKLGDPMLFKEYYPTLRASMVADNNVGTTEDYSPVNVLLETSTSSEPVQSSESSAKIQISKEKYTRASVLEDFTSMYLFTDNAQRTSAPKAIEENVNKTGWYYRKYKSQTDKPISFGTLANPTSAVIRGLNNAYPISTMSAYGTNWVDGNFELFKETINDEIAQIKNDLQYFNTLKLGDYRIGQGGLKAKLPLQHQNYLDSKLLELGIDNTGNTPKLVKQPIQNTPETGKPGVFTVWHGSETDIKEFKSEFPEGFFHKAKGGSLKAIFFSKDKAPSDSVYGKRPYQKQFQVTMSNPLVVNYSDPKGNEGGKNREQWIQEAIDKGYDGVIWRNIHDNFVTDVYVSLDSKNIKAVEQPINKEIKPKIDSSKKINIYASTNENADLSNFAIRPFEYNTKRFTRDTIKFQSVEQAFQFMKLEYSTSSVKNESIANKILETTDGKTLRGLGKSFDLKKDGSWDRNSSKIMKELLKASFQQNPKALEKLLATGNAELTHTQDKSRWGTKQGDLKTFPELLMEVREELKPEDLLNCNL